jgi:hypothetical protein
MYLQDGVIALMFAENDRVLSRVTPRFFVIWDGDTGVVNFDGEVFQPVGLPR